MPVAALIRDHLGVSPDLMVVVTMIAAVSGTLAALAQQGVAHRDIKPENLYWYDSLPAIGDFGLVEYPEQADLTRWGKPLGPRYYLAPEMIAHPEDADGGPADVYSLAKTLWVLASGQTYPPPGDIRRDTPAVRLGMYVAHPRVRSLERLIERATAHDPQMRPATAEIHEELTAWVQVRDESLPPPTLTDAVLRLVDATAPSRRQAQRRDESMQDAEDYLTGLVSALEGVIRQAQQLAAGAMTVRESPWLPPKWDVLGVARAEVARLRIYASIVGREIQGPVHGGASRDLFCGVAVSLYSDGIAVLMAGYWVVHRSEDEMLVEPVWEAIREVETGSIRAHLQCSELAAELTSVLPSALLALLPQDAVDNP
jgi:hypothetical protein